MIDNQISFPLTTKQCDFLRYYSVKHKISMAEIMRRMIEQLKKEERESEAIELKKGIIFATAREACKC